MPAKTPRATKTQTSFGTALALAAIVALGGAAFGCSAGSGGEDLGPSGGGGSAQADAHPDTNGDGPLADQSVDGNDGSVAPEGGDADASQSADADASAIDGADDGGDEADSALADGNADADAGPPPCASDGDCAGSADGPVCDVASGKCFQCLPTNDVCPLGEYCGTGNHCTTGCKASSDCAAGADGGATDGGDAGAMSCNPATHQCVGCLADGDCPPGSLCDANGSCAPGCTAQHACSTGRSCCGSTCVDEQTDKTNCGACGTVCAPVANGKEACTAGACAIGSCDTGWMDCDTLVSTGCEVHTDADPTHCGACQVACSTVNATPSCTAGACVLACAPGFADCDKVASTGCEASTDTDVSNCGTCGKACSTTGGVASCTAGACGIVCNAGFADCNTSVADGCEVSTDTSATHCGSCANACAVAHATAACTSGLCAVGSCNAGYADCNSDPADGCEALLSSDGQNCGSCGVSCTVPHANSSCANGACKLGTCSPGFVNCDGNASNGCEIDVTTDPGNCGGCGFACTVPHATAGCAAQTCTVATCDPGYADCNGNAADGCEVNTASSPTNCGGCGKKCLVANGTPGCTNSVCSVATCNAGFADCNNDPTDGCEVYTTSDVDHCGSCGKVCSKNNASPSCANGTCSIASCNAGFGDCNADPSDGCEVNVKTSISNCGTCGKVCTSPNGTPACTNGGCTVSNCSAPFADCNGNAADGCEANTQTSVANCGGCGNACATPNAVPACASGVCAIAQCNAGFANCNGQLGDGCETNVVTNPLNCGGCGVVCAIANGSAGCANGACTVLACNAGFADCDNNPANGCETNVGTDNNNCGMCGKACSAANGVAACAGGACTVASCNAGFADCNNQPADGCETNTSNDPLDCGACNKQCSAANGVPGCSAGTCTIAACNSGFGNCDGNVANGCETNLTNNVVNCGTCGHNCATSCVGNVTATSCNAGTCGVTGCAAGWNNVNGACADGCECLTSGTSASCLAPSSLGSLAIGQTTSYSGNLVPAGQEAYLTVTFTGNTSYSYHPHVKLTAGATEFAFDVLTNCSGSAMSCGVEGGNSGLRADWEVLYTAGDPSQPSEFNVIPPVGNAGTILIHVYRRAGQAVTCNNYTLTVSN